MLKLSHKHYQIYLGKNPLNFTLVQISLIKLTISKIVAIVKKCIVKTEKCKVSIFIDFIPSKIDKNKKDQAEFKNK